MSDLRDLTPRERQKVTRAEVAEALEDAGSSRTSPTPANLDDPAVLEQILAGAIEGDDGPGGPEWNGMRRSLELRLESARARDAARQERAEQIDAMTPAEFKRELGRAVQGW